MRPIQLLAALPGSNTFDGTRRRVFKLTLFRQESVEVAADVFVLVHALTQFVRSAANAICAFDFDVASERHSSRMPLNYLSH